MAQLQSSSFRCVESGREPLDEFVNNPVVAIHATAATNVIQALTLVAIVCIKVADRVKTV